PNPKPARPTKRPSAPTAAPPTSPAPRRLDPRHLAQVRERYSLGPRFKSFTMASCPARVKTSIHSLTQSTLTSRSLAAALGVLSSRRHASTASTTLSGSRLPAALSGLGVATEKPNTLDTAGGGAGGFGLIGRWAAGSP